MGMCHNTIYVRHAAYFASNHRNIDDFFLNTLITYSCIHINPKYSLSNISQTPLDMFYFSGGVVHKK